MKDFLEGLEIGEGKVKLSKDEIKLILAENGKVVTNETTKVREELTKDIDAYKGTIANLEEKIKGAPASEDMAKLQKEIDDMKKAEADRISAEKAKSEDEILTNNIVSVFGDKKFTSEYAKNGLINDIKAEINKPENKGKGISDIFTNLTKDKEGIFESDNKIPEIPGYGDKNPNVSEDDFVDKVMGLK